MAQLLLDAGANVQVIQLAKRCCVDSYEHHGNLAIGSWSGACVPSRTQVAGVLSSQVLMSGI